MSVQVNFTNDMQVPFVAKEWTVNGNQFRLVITKFRPPYDFEFEVECMDTDAMGELFWRREDADSRIDMLIKAFCNFYSKDNVTLPF